MLHFFTGTPGSGKSLHMAMLIDRQLRAGRNVIANFEINERMYDRFRKRHPGKLGISYTCRTMSFCIMPTCAPSKRGGQARPVLPVFPT